MEVNYGGNFANSAVFIRELRRMMPRERRFRYNRRARRPEAPPVVPSPSLNDLYNSIEAAIALPSGRGHVSSYRAMEAAERGEEFNASVLKHTAVPSVKHHSVDVYDHRVYGARFVGEHGQRYVTSCQDQSIRVYETNMSDSPLAWVRTHNIPARGAYWTITDFDVSPDGRWLAYASISNFVHLVDLCNPHEPQVVLDFSISPKDIYSSAAAQPRFEGRVHIWSLKWGHDGTEIIVGTGAVHRRSYGLVLVYDVALRRVVEVIPAHDDDVNSVCFMQTGERNLLLSGSDDTLGKSSIVCIYCYRGDILNAKCSTNFFCSPSDATRRAHIANILV